MKCSDERRLNAGSIRFATRMDIKWEVQRSERCFRYEQTGKINFALNLLREVQALGTGKSFVLDMLILRQLLNLQ